MTVIASLYDGGASAAVIYKGQACTAPQLQGALFVSTGALASLDVPSTCKPF